MSSKQRWRIYLHNVETRIGVGIYAQEQVPQRVIVNIAIEGNYPLKPRSVADCFNYDPIYQLLTEEWPSRAHRYLLETCVAELLEYVFRIDERVEYVKASVCKPDIFPKAESVGVEAEWTRADYERHKGA